MSDESALRQKVREAIRTGKLPNRPPQQLWGGPGAGARCTICDSPVHCDEVEFEFQFVRDGDHPRLSNSHVHLRCFVAWELECQNCEVAWGATSRGDQMRSATHRHVDDGASESSSSVSVLGRVLPAEGDRGTMAVYEHDTTHRGEPP